MIKIDSTALGIAAYDAAAKVTGCYQPWEEANQEKWIAAAEAIEEPITDDRNSATRRAIVRADAAIGEQVKT